MEFVSRCARKLRFLNLLHSTRGSLLSRRKAEYQREISGMSIVIWLRSHGAVFLDECEYLWQNTILIIIMCRLGHTSPITPWPFPFTYMTQEMTIRPSLVPPDLVGVFRKLWNVYYESATYQVRENKTRYDLNWLMEVYVLTLSILYSCFIFPITAIKTEHRYHCLY